MKRTITIMAVMAVVLLAIFIWLIYPLIEENGW